MCLAAGLAILAKMNAWDELFDRGMLKRFWLVVALFVLLIVMSFARLYMVYAMVSLIIVFSLSLGWLSRFVLALLCLVLGFIFIPTLVGTLEFSLPGNAVSASSDLTLAGRTVIWERSLSLIAERPLGGYGFGVFDAPYFDWMWGAYRAPHAHNSFIQAAFDLGLLGVLMTGGLVLAHIRRASNLAFHPGRYHMAMFVVLLCVLASLTGVTYAGKPSLMMGIVLIVVSFGGRECSNQPKLDHCAFGSGK
jgi:O-antigen ligase